MGKQYTIGRVMKHKKNVMYWIPQPAEGTVGTRMTSQGGNAAWSRDSARVPGQDGDSCRACYSERRGLFQPAASKFLTLKISMANDAVDWNGLNADELGSPTRANMLGIFSSTRAVERHP
jgi:hypothetical protein